MILIMRSHLIREVVLYVGIYGKIFIFKQVVVVVFLADLDTDYNRKAIKEITSKFSDLIEMGFLQIIQASKEYYPILDNLKRNFQDGENR